MEKKIGNVSARAILPRGLPLLRTDVARTQVGASDRTVIGNFSRQPPSPSQGTISPALGPNTRRARVTPYLRMGYIF